MRQTHLSHRLSRVTLRVTNSVSNGKRFDPYLTYISTYIREISTRAAGRR